MARTWAIGDIHGCNTTFRALLFNQLRITPDDEIYILGDMVDRGPDSKGVIDTIVALQAEGYQIHVLRGNHEQIMLSAFTDSASLLSWLKYGGIETLRSFGARELEEIPGHYINFLNRTEYCRTTDRYIFLHAGLNMDLDDPFQDTESMMWDRRYQYDEVKAGGRCIVHGHTPKELEQIIAQPVSGSINIDGGCVYPQYGYLVALHMETGTYYIQPNIENRSISFE